MNELCCPVCDSENIEPKFIDFEVPLPMGDRFSYKKEIHICKDCKQEGVMLKEVEKQNHSRYLTALKEANAKTLNQILEDFTSWDVSLAHIERSLSLPQRTISRWKAAGDSEKGISSAGIALLRIVHTYPWMLKVADEGFKQSIADKEVIDQAWEINESRRIPKDAPPSTTLSGGNYVSSSANELSKNTESGGNVVHIEEFREEA